MEELKNENQLIEILKLGLIGLVFLFMLFTFRLLKTEQGKDSPRENILQSIKTFSGVTLIAAVLVGIFSILEMKYRPVQSKNCDQCRESLEIMVELASSPEHNVESLRSLIKNQVEPCLEKMKIEN